MTAGWTVLAMGAVVVAAIHAFLFWWARGPGKDAKYHRQPREPSLLPGGTRLWANAFAYVYASPLAVFAALNLIGDVSVGKAAFWALAAFVGGQLIFFVLGGALGLWRLTRIHRAGSDDKART